MGDAEGVGLLYLGLVKDGVGGPWGLGGVLVCVEGTDLAVLDAGQTVDGQGEVVPRADALVAVVVDAGLEALADDGGNGPGQVGGTGGRAYLVEDYTQGVALTAQANHRLDEVVAVGRVEPGGADDDGTAAEAHHVALASQFGRAIDGVGTGCVGLAVGKMGGAVEDVVCRDVDKGGACLLGSLGQERRGLMIKAVAQFGVLLGLVNGGVGGTVYDELYALLAEATPNRLGVADVQLGHVGKEPTVSRILQGYRLHLVAQLPVGACY